MSVLESVRVVDMGYGEASGLATRLLADAGAEIIRVDRPAASSADAESRLVRARSRKSIVVRPEVIESEEVVRRLLLWADVVIAEPGFESGSSRLGEYRALMDINPRLILCRLTAYGDEGPLADAPACDHVIAARYGLYNHAGWDGPVYVAAPMPPVATALLAVQGIGVALYQREVTGRGQEVQTSHLAGALAFQPDLVAVALGEANPEQNFSGGSRTEAAPFMSPYECGDGRWLQFGCIHPSFQRQAAAALGLEQELGDLGFGTEAAPRNRRAIGEVISRRLKQKSFAEWAAVLEQEEFPFAPVQAVGDLFDHPQVQDLGLAVTIEQPGIGSMEQVGPAMFFSGEPFRLPSPAPQPGQNTNEVCAILGFSPAEVASLRGQGAIEGEGDDRTT